MEDTTRQLLIRRVLLLRRKLKPLLDDLKDAERAAAILGVSPDELDEAAVGKGKKKAERPGMTIKEMSLEALREDFPDGTTCGELAAHLEKRYGRKVDRASVSPQLGRLKKAGIVELDGVIWKIVS